jgi:hypothetical protein
VLAHLNAGPNGSPEFPQPWPSIPENSFLADNDDTKRDLAAAGFDILSFEDQTPTSLPSQIAYRKKIEAEGFTAGSACMCCSDPSSCNYNATRKGSGARMHTTRWFSSRIEGVRPTGGETCCFPPECAGSLF